MPKNFYKTFSFQNLILFVWVISKYRTSFQKAIIIFEKSKESDVDALLSDFLL